MSADVAAALRAIGQGVLALADALERSASTAPTSIALRLVSRAELLEKLSISSPTLRKLEARGVVPFVAVGDLRRYDAAAVLAALAALAAQTRPAKESLSNVVALSRGRAR